MKVLLIHQAFVTPEESGGTRHYELAEHSRSEGIEFTVVASNVSYLTGRPVTAERRLVQEEWAGGLRILRAYTLSTLHRSFIWRVAAHWSFMITSIYAALRAGPVDVVMGTSPPIFQAGSSWLVSALKRKPFLLEIRDLWPGFAIDMGVLKNPALIALSRWLENFLYARAAKILVNSPAYRDHLEQRGIAADKLALIANGVDLASFAGGGTDPEYRKTMGWENRFVVTYAGALGLANDLPVILKAAERLKEEKNIHFVLAGDGKERPKLEAMASEMGLWNVTFLGVRPKQEIPRLLAASDACVAALQNIPMFRMTYPNKVFDYMAAGKPTLLLIDGVIRDVVEAASGGTFIPPGDDEALANAVKGYAANPSLGEAQGKAAREYVERHFNRKDQARQFSELLQSLGTRRA